MSGAHFAERLTIREEIVREPLCTRRAERRRELGPAVTRELRELPRFGAKLGHAPFYVAPACGVQQALATRRILAVGFRLARGQPRSRLEQREAGLYEGRRPLGAVRDVLRERGYLVA
jgi:hypothetical protein